MKPNFISNEFLRTAAGENEGGGGGGTATDTKPPVAGGEEQQQSEKPKSLNIIQLAAASMRDKGALAADLKQSQDLHAAAQTRISTLEAENQTLRDQAAAHTADMATLNAAFVAEEQKTKVVEVAAAQKIVALGFEEKQLPGQQVASSETKEALESQLGTEKDPAKRWELQEKLEALIG